MYDLHKLGWDSFQRLCLTITREILGQTVESFLNSHDGGLDGAFAGTWTAVGQEDLSGNFVIQCKFTSRANYNLTESALSDEFKKARNLVDKGICDSYALMTNAGLSGDLKTKIDQRLKSVGVKHVRIHGSDWINQQILENKRLRTLVPRVYGLGDLSQILDERAYEQSGAVLEFMKEDLAKVVVTDAYQAAVDAINKHGFVLLIGEPAAGKTTIASLLAMAALDQWNSLVLKLTVPGDVVERWNTHEASQFFWVDDAFGVTQYEDSLVWGWNRALPEIRTMLSRGAKIVMTSRDYIYNRARHDLKESAFPLLNESQVVIDVHNLSLEEKRQILYNHLKLGNQPNSFRTKIKPFLEGVASHPRFIPETARRLADPIFTNKVPIRRHELHEFVEKRELLLQELLENLDNDSKAALALIYMRNGLLESPIHVHPLEEEALKRLGSDIGRIRIALEALRGSLVLHSDTDDQPAWRFRHPTIGDSYAAILAESPDLIDIFVQGSAPDRLVRQVTCGNVGIENAIVIPRSLFPQMLTKLEELPSTGLHKSSWLSNFQTREDLLGFLSRRCSTEFLSLYVQQNPDVLNRVSSPGMMLEAVPEVSLAKRLHEFELLPEENRMEFVSTASKYLLDGDDGGVLYDVKVQSLFTDSEFSDLILRVRDELIPELEDVRDRWESAYDSDHIAEDFMQPLYDLYRALRARFDGEQSLIDKIDHEERLTDQWVGDHQPEESEMEPRELETTEAQDGPQSERSIFDDIDEDEAPVPEEPGLAQFFGDQYAVGRQE